MPSGLAMFHPFVSAHIDNETFNTKFDNDEVYDVCVCELLEYSLSNTEMFSFWALSIYAEVLVIWPLLAIGYIVMFIMVTTASEKYHSIA